MTTNEPTKPSLYPATCVGSGTLRYRRVGYGSLCRLLCLHCDAKVTTTQAGVIRKHCVGGKQGILIGPRGEG